MDLRAALLNNWGYKISAFLLATLLWVNVTADERQTQDVATLLEIEVRDTAWVLVGAPADVRTAFQGPTRDLLALSLDGRGPVIRQVIDSVTGPGMDVTLSSDDVRFDRTLDVRPVGVAPTVLSLRFEPRVERVVPVVPDLEPTPASGWTIVRPFLVQPDSARVWGAESAVRSVSRLGTSRVPLEDLDHTVTRELPILLPPGLGEVEFEPPTTLVTVQVDSLVERRLRLPVTAVGPGAAGVRLSEDSVVATVRGAWGAVRSRLPTLRAAIVRVDRRLGGPEALPVVVDLPEDLFITVEVQPPSVVASPRANGR
ncbi:MAG: CdaR family protein [Gemmatimonadota bacterium]